jgi:Ni,Fe-hydrogenase III large subunit
LRVLVVPGPDVARAYGLDPVAVGMRMVATPRHANVMMLVGALSPAMQSAAVILYAQMMRPRVLCALGSDDFDPLPTPEVRCDLSQTGLIASEAQLRVALAQHAFLPHAVDFTAAMLDAHVEYTCSMHPDVAEDAPGSCPKCGMDLIPREGAAPDASAHGHAHDHGHGGQSHHPPDPESSAHAAMDHGKMDHGKANPGDDSHTGMDHEKKGHDPAGGPHRGGDDKHHGNMDSGDKPQSPEKDDDRKKGEMNDDEMGFMSMVDVTKDLPRSPDGLPMDWIEVPFGPVFPGLPGGLQLSLTLDGDSVANARVQGLDDAGAILPADGIEARQFIDRLAAMDPLAPVSYRVLACRALEAASGHTPADSTLRSRVAVLERERIASHLNWLALFASQIGLEWLEHRAARLQHVCLQADADQFARLGPTLAALTHRVARNPLLRSRLGGIGKVAPLAGLRGPVARAAGMQVDARSNDATYAALAFTPAQRHDGDALDRLFIRLDEIRRSLALIQTVGAFETLQARAACSASGEGAASLETPRGEARLSLTVDQGQVTRARLDAPSAQLLDLVPDLLAQQELGDALTIVCSLDPSPWQATR